MSLRVLVIGTDSPHRRYLLNKLLDAGVSLIGCVFETEKVQPSFPIGPVFEHEELSVLKEACIHETRWDLDRLPIWYVSTANDMEALEIFNKLRPDIAIVSGAGRLGPRVISAFQGSLLNIHMGIASRYRGLDSNLWAIYHNDWDSIGITIHMVEEKLDTGPIVDEARLALEPGITCAKLRYYEAKLAVELLRRALNQRQEGSFSAKKQDHIGRYYSFMPKDLRIVVQRRFDNKYLNKESSNGK